MRPKLKKKLLRRLAPPTNPAQNAQNKYGNAIASKDTSTGRKSNSITLEVSNKATPLNTSIMPTKIESIDYNIVEYLKRARANISIFELAKIACKRELLVQDFSQSSSGDKASTSQKVFGKADGTLKYVVNVVMLDANNIYPPIYVNFQNI